MVAPQDLIFGIVRVNDAIVGVPIHNLSEVCHVEELTALPVKSDYLLGGFDLRNNAIPVLNFRKICGFPSTPQSSKLMMVINHQKLFLAFSIDEVLGIAQTTAKDIQSLQSSEAKTNSHYSGIFAHGEDFISVLDIRVLFDLQDVFAITRPMVTDVEKKEEARTPMLVFETGDVLFSVPAVDVYAAVPRQDIAQTAITGGPCLGEVSYYNRRIPVICPIDFFAVGTAHKYAQTQIVVLKFPNNRLLGMAVDSVQTIEGFSNTQDAKMPLWLEDECYIKGVTTRQDHRQVFEIDLDAMFESETAQTLASLSDSVAQDDTFEKASASDLTTKDVVHERQKYLVVKAGMRLAIPLEDVSYILEPPTNITPAPSQRQGFKGYFSRFGQSVALFDLCALVGNVADDVPRDRLLLTGENERQIAFCVEKVIGIEQSEWREANSESGPTSSVVKIATSDQDTILPYLSLATILQEQIQASRVA